MKAARATLIALTASASLMLLGYPLAILVGLVTADMYREIMLSWSAGYSAVAITVGAGTAIKRKQSKGE